MKPSLKKQPLKKSDANISNRGEIIIKAKLTAFFLLLCVLSLSLNVASCSQSIPYKYIALGDSIAFGYGLEDPETMCYPFLLSKALPSIVGEREIEYSNHAVSGMTSADLLSLLSQNSIDFDGAELVTICIGANNLLKPLTASFKAIADKYGIGESFSGFDKIGSFFDELGTALEGEEMSAEFQKGIDSFSVDFDLILSKLKEAAPNATVAVMTVYSPFKDFNLTIPYLGIDLRVGDLSDKWVAKLNEQIITIAEKYGCVTVNTFEPFYNESFSVNAAFGLVPPRFSFDPHPTKKGHELLERLHLEAIKEHLSKNAAAVQSQRFVIMQYKN